MIDNDTINNRRFTKIIYPNTEISRGAQAKGGTGLYNSISGSKKPLANLLRPINNPKGTPTIIPATKPRNTQKKSPKYVQLGLVF